MAVLRFELSEPRHGWMTVRVRTDSDELASDASCVVDCLTELVYAALEVLERRPVRSIVLFEEPAAKRISFSGDSDDIELQITQHRDLTAAQCAQNGTPLMRATAGRRALAWAIWSAVRRLEGTAGPERTTASWHNQFPEKELAQLGAKLH